MIHVVLLEPEIPWNTGNIGRTCLGAGAQLHLVGRLGFHLDNKEVQRAGLDYWEKVQLQRHESWENFLTALPAQAKVFFFSTKGKRILWEAEFQDEAYLVFGKETGCGSPAGVARKFSVFSGPARLVAGRRLRHFVGTSQPTVVPASSQAVWRRPVGN